MEIAEEPREHRKLRDGDSWIVDEAAEGKMTREEINRGIEHARALHPNARESIRSFFPPSPKNRVDPSFFSRNA